MAFLFSSRGRHTRSVSAFLLNRSSDLLVLLLAVLLLLLLVAPCLNCLEAVKKPPPVAFKVMCLLPITILKAWVMLVLNLPFKALMFLTLMRPSLVLFLRSEERRVGKEC